MIRVLVVDGDPTTRDGLRAALDTTADIEIVGDVATGEEAIEFVGEQEPDVVVMDFELPDMSGIQATERIRDNHINTKVILLTENRFRASTSEAIGAGVSGYLLKKVRTDELVDAARLAVQGRAVIDPALNEAFVEEIRKTEGSPEAPLTGREVEILRMIAKELNDQGVADSLGVPPAVVELQLQRIREKLGLHDPEPPLETA